MKTNRLSLLLTVGILAISASPARADLSSFINKVGNALDPTKDGTITKTLVNCQFTIGFSNDCANSAQQLTGSKALGNALKQGNVFEQGSFANQMAPTAAAGLCAAYGLPQASPLCASIVQQITSRNGARSGAVQAGGAVPGAFSGAGYGGPQVSPDPNLVYSTNAAERMNNSALDAHVEINNQVQQTMRQGQQSQERIESGRNRTAVEITGIQAGTTRHISDNQLRGTVDTNSSQVQMNRQNNDTTRYVVDQQLKYQQRAQRTQQYTDWNP